ncbi:MAG: hypothetical protein JEZ09_15110 [Salinivirgaceae bacterium]|nr:hypothetical protein [Salinivirgaceae bacterium]
MESKAQFDYNPDIKKTHNLILGLQFQKAQNFITSNENENNGLWIWLKAQKCFIENLSKTETNKTDSTIDILNLCIINLTKYESNNPYFDYSLADIYLYKSFLQLNQENYLSALQNFYKAKRHVENLIIDHPSFEASKKQQLIIQAATNYVKNYFNTSYKLETTTLNSIQTSSDNNKIIDRELKIILPLISYASNETSSINKDHFRWLTNDYFKIGPLEAFTYSFVMSKQQNYNSQLKALSYSDSVEFLNRFNYLNLMYGTALLNKMDSNGVLKLNNYILNNKSTNGNAYANLKCAWFYFIKPNHEKHKQYISKINLNKSYKLNIDKQAMQEISIMNQWKPELIKSRMLFDAGEYHESMTILLQDKTKISSYNENQKLEYAYRLARNYQMLQENESALRFYKIVIASNLDSKYYYPSYSAYNCGMINAKTKNYKLAEFYFKLCLNLDAPIYKKTIHSKAKMALENLSNQLK